MEIIVNRVAKRNLYTIGKMSINGEYYCDTLEDKDRGLRQDMPLDEIKKIKVYGETAIPTGTYKVTTTYWSKHKVHVPYILNVPGYTGILIHNGTDQTHTLGCILVGENRIVGKLLNGKRYMTDLYNMIHDCNERGESVTIEIR